MRDFFKNLPEIIESAAQGPLAILALVILIMAGLVYMLSSRDKPWVKVTMFIALLIGLAGFTTLLSDADQYSELVPISVVFERIHVIDDCDPLDKPGEFSYVLGIDDEWFAQDSEVPPTNAGVIAINHTQPIIRPIASEFEIHGTVYETDGAARTGLPFSRTLWSGTTGLEEIYLVPESYEGDPCLLKIDINIRRGSQD